MITPVFIVLAVVTLSGAILSMTLRNLVHCALALTITFAGLAALYLRLDAQFIGFAQILVYVGAVAILIVFAILLTRGNEPGARSIFSSSWAVGAAVALLVFGVLARAIVTSPALSRMANSGDASNLPSATVGQIGNQLMTRYILPLEVVGLLLTAALIGAAIIAMHEKEAK